MPHALFDYISIPFGLIKLSGHGCLGRPDCGSSLFELSLEGFNEVIQQCFGCPCAASGLAVLSGPVESP